MILLSFIGFKACYSRSLHHARQEPRTADAEAGDVSTKQFQMGDDWNKKQGRLKHVDHFEGVVIFFSFVADLRVHKFLWLIYIDLMYSNAKVTWTSVAHAELSLMFWKGQNVWLPGSIRRSRPFSCKMHAKTARSWKLTCQGVHATYCR